MSKKTLKTVIIFLDTDTHTSPFDMLTAVDLFPDAQIFHYSNVTPDNARRLIQDAMFPRGPEGAKYTKIFIGGDDVDKALEILSVAKKNMFPPFELSIIVDPRGAYTTASAVVAKTFLWSMKKGFDGFDGKTVTVLAGTGPVGQTAARLYATENANVVVTSRNLARATMVSEKINEEIGDKRAVGRKAETSTEVGKAIENSDIIVAAGAAKVQLLPLKILREYGKRCRIVADVNAVPPLGVEGLKSTDEGVEILPKVWGIGAISIGTFKNKVEARLFKAAVESSKGIFDYKIAYKEAKDMTLAKLQKLPEA
ncbi:MAG: methylene-tetrahydromethanopterin dehydrogenase N-terminal domain-containing protein [Candidatus Bathyarchaeia archaeon]